MSISLAEAIDQVQQMLREDGSEVASDPERSVDICRAILGRYPNLPEAQRLLGLNLRRLGDASGAERAFASALQSDPRDAASLWELGLLAESRGELETALAYVQAAWEIDPWRRDRRERVVSLSQAVYGSDGRLQLTRAALASIYYRAGRWDRAVDECAEVVSELGERLDVQLLMAAALCREGRFGWAAASCRDVLDRTPNAVDALLLLAEIERRDGNLAEAGWLRERAFAIDPSPERPSALLGFAGDESRAFFQPADVTIDLAGQSVPAGTLEVEHSARVEVASQTEDRLIAFEDRSSAGAMPELVELPQMPETPQWIEDHDFDRADETSSPPWAAPEPRSQLGHDREPETSETKVEPGAAIDDDINVIPLPEPARASEPEPSVDVDELLEMTGAEDEPEDLFAPWIPPAMVPPARRPAEEPGLTDAVPDVQSDEVDQVIVEDETAVMGFDTEVAPVAVPAEMGQTEEPEVAAPPPVEEPPTSDAEGELERLRRCLQEAPDSADEVVAGLEELIARFPASAAVPAAHRLAGSIYRKQGKPAQASLHYRLSLAAGRGGSE